MTTDPVTEPAPLAYPIDTALREAHRKALASREPSEMAAAQLDLAIRQHPLFDRLVRELGTHGLRIPEPRRTPLAEKVALIAAPDFAPEQSPLANARACAELIMHDVDVPDGQEDATVRQTLLLAVECLLPAPRNHSAGPMMRQRGPAQPPEPSLSRRLKARRRPR